MPHTSLIDWGGFVGDVGQIYIISYDKADIIPIDHKLNQYIIEDESGEQIAIRIGSNGYPKIRINKAIGHKVSLSKCKQIAKVQVKCGYTSISEIRKKSSVQLI